MSGFTPYNSDIIRSKIELIKQEGNFIIEDGLGSVTGLKNLFRFFCYNATTDVLEIDSPVTPYVLPETTSSDEPFIKIVGNSGKISITFDAVDINYLTDSEYSAFRASDPSLPTSKTVGLNYVKPEVGFSSVSVKTHEDVRNFIADNFEPLSNNKYSLVFYDKQWGSDPLDNSRSLYTPKAFNCLPIKTTVSRIKGNSPKIYTVSITCFIGDNLTVVALNQPDEDDGGNNG